MLDIQMLTKENDSTSLTFGGYNVEMFLVQADNDLTNIRFRVSNDICIERGTLDANRFCSR